MNKTLVKSECLKKEEINMNKTLVKSEQTYRYVHLLWCVLHQKC